MRTMLAYLLLLLAAGAARAQADVADRLAPLAHWVGGQRVTSFKTAKGEEVRTIRSYEWSPFGTWVCLRDP